jgi:hypothetical protein
MKPLILAFLLLLSGPASAQQSVVTPSTTASIPSSAVDRLGG